MEAVLTPVYVGVAGESGVFRINLAESGLSTIRSIVIEDDNRISGGSGAASGFDLDQLKIAPMLGSNPSEISTFTPLNAFNFSTTGVVYKLGFLQPYNFIDPIIANQNRLFGTVDGVVDLPGATLDLLDGVDWNDAAVGQKAVSIGEGGRIGFTLNSALSPSGLYLYVADVGGGNDGFRVRVSDAPPQLLPGLTLEGTDFDDVIDLTQGFNGQIGLGDDTLSGGSGNDTILSGEGNDTVNGDSGDDNCNGGNGNDIVTGGTGSDRLVGDKGNDTLNGGDDNDQINGGDGRDRINAGLGNDRVILGKGKDICEVIRGIGITKILDFQDGQDRIDLPKNIKFGKLSFDQRGRNTQVSIGNDPLFTLVKVQVSILTATDFI
jgi:Ca2+-binding RTX toxin-like protein